MYKFNGRRYYPDFYLKIKDKQVIIEYNGAQHYKPVRFVGMNEKDPFLTFKKQKIRDKQLRDYCKINDILLLEIPYYWKHDKVIEELKSFIKNII